LSFGLHSYFKEVRAREFQFGIFKKLVSSQGNKKEDIDKRKKKKDVQVSSTLGVTQTPVDIESPK
jgi:hypothetical protein